MADSKTERRRKRRARDSHSEEEEAAAASGSNSLSFVVYFYKGSYNHGGKNIWSLLAMARRFVLF